VEPEEHTNVWVSDDAWRKSCQVHWGLPKHFDLLRFAREGQRVQGAFGLMRANRLLEDLPKQTVVKNLASMPADCSGVVWFEFAGYYEVGRLPQVRLKVQTKLAWVCQRCMKPMWQWVNESVLFNVVRREGPVNQNADGETVDTDVPEELLTDPAFDLFELIEDQVILALPYVPKHDSCESAAPVVEEEPEQPKVSPFEELAALKRR
jgi:uncharacterized protein